MNYDRIILELMDRVSTLEDEIEKIKQNQTKVEVNEGEELVFGNTTDSYGRDTTKYIFEGKRYGKNRLVLAIIKKYISENPNTTVKQLLTVFDKSLQGSLGVVRKLDEVKNAYADYKRRFFVSPNEIIKTTTGDCVVCTQWGIGNIGNIITRAKQLDINVTVIK